jgi:glyoxylate reductase
MSWNVYITRRIPQSAITQLVEQGFNVEVFKGDEIIPGELLKEKATDCDILLCLLTDKINEDILFGAKNLKMIANYAVGYNNINLEAATRLGIPVTNTPGVLTEATADLTFLLLLGVARRVVEADRMVRKGKFKGWGPMLLLGSELSEKTLGIIGTGRIGSAVARRAAGFNMNILYTDTKSNLDIEKAYLATRTDLKTLLQESDFITIHVPLSGTTFHLINSENLNLMKKSAILINTSRGAVVDEKALVNALQSGQIAGAGLDVFEFEPDLTPGLAKLNNTILLPHIASATTETRTRMAEIAVENILSFYEGKIPPNIVNPEVLNMKK